MWYLGKQGKSQVFTAFSVAHVVALQMDCFYTLKGIIDKVPLPFITRKYYMMRLLLQVAYQGHTSGSMSQPPVKWSN